MAEFLSDDSKSLKDLRRQLSNETSTESEDLLGRLNAMEFLDSLVEPGLDMPEQLGDYRIKGVLGRGGMGSVYLAWQVSLEREVALKVLSPKFSSDLTMRKRFRSEARASAAMHHQHIVPIYDYGEAQGHLYFAMELVHGVSLDRHISAMRRHGRGLLESREAARRFAGVADALALAHKRQILHRDVKPGNIMVHRDGTFALVDFGLSKFLGRDSMNLTSVGGFLGTLHYSPPEQARSKQVTPASDLYSLGVTIFETVSGELPLTGGSTEAVLQSLLNDEPKRLRQVLPKAPKDLESVLEKLLQKEPGDRYEDGESLAMDLRRVAEGEPVRIRRQTWVGRVWRRAKRHPVQSTALATTALLLLVSLVFMRGWISNWIQRVELDGQKRLREAYNTALKEPGLPFGPRGLLTALTGVPCEPRWETAVTHHLEKAREFLPASDEPRRYENAYFKDPEPQATVLLLAGKGLSAIEALGQRIAEESPESTNFQMDEVAWLRLYPLYLGRAMAALTAAVGDVDQARADLQLASFVRPGSFLPKLLKVFVAWRATEGAESLVASLSQVLAGGDLPANSRRAAGAMLLAFAGISPPAGAHLMRFPMDYKARKRLHEVAMQWLDRVPVPVPGPGPVGRYGLEGALASGAQEGLKHISDRPRLDAALRAGRTLLREEIANTSPLASWAFTYALIAGEDSPADAGQQLPGAIHLLELDPDATWLRTKKEILEQVIQGAGGSADGLRLRALLDQKLASPAEFAKSARGWAAAEPDSAEALLCRFHGRLVSGDLDDVSEQRMVIEAVQVVQAAADRSTTERRLVGVLQEARRGADSKKLRNIQAVLATFGVDGR